MDQVVTVIPTPGAPEGHDAAMVAKADKATADALAASGAAPVSDERPAWLPEKFKTTEDMAKAYAELEAKQSAPAVKPGATSEADPAGAAEVDPAAEAAATKAGLSLAELETEFRAQGKVSEANMAKLKAAGFSEADVATYIAGREAQVTLFSNAVIAETPGGPEKYGEMVEWAKANLSEAERTAYNKAIDSGDVAQAKLAVAGLGVKFSAAVGSEPNLAGGRVNTAPGDVYESMAQVTADMKDPKYQNDPAFRAKVQAKLGRSEI